MGFTQTAITVVSEDPYFEAYTFENLLDAPLEGNPVETTTLMRENQLSA
ncbi:hypothetical protein PC118_g13988 [Phytophthora cactorum]|uniref:Uncharacterized protein n=1 Tax=Phytophthora cactorum TaxID=29920 RepID=A0A8T1BPY1_9STRA|nr:hypothetical protein PC115_g13883 [Phytophthora cactorum]KAG2975327.1 hypothetical protein PC118_g13988 [Phytophthora cactorum]